MAPGLVTSTTVQTLPASLRILLTEAAIMEADDAGFGPVCNSITVINHTFTNIPWLLT